MSAGVGVVVLGVIFAIGVAVFGLLLIGLLPAATLLDELLDAILARRSAAARSDAPDPPG